MTIRIGALASSLAVLAAVALPAVLLAESGQPLCYRALTWLGHRSGLPERQKLQTARETGPEELAYFDTAPGASREPSGEPILLLHGFTADKDTWLGMIRRLRKNHRVVALDLAGHGESSDAADGDYRLSAQAERADLLANALGLGELHVLGHSMGGGVAVALALAHPERVISLGLLAPAAKGDPHTEEFMRHLRGEARPGPPINPLIVGPNWSGGERVRYVANGPWWLRLGSRLSSCLNQTSPERRKLHSLIFKQLTGEPPRAPFSDEQLARIRQPTFIWWGADDRVLRPAVDFYKRHLGGPVEGDVWPGFGHTLPVEAPAETARAYLAFLEGLQP